MKPSEMTDEQLVRAVILEVMDISLYQSTWWITEPDNKDPVPFSPLTNANHWMMVVKRMRELGWWCRILVMPHSTNLRQIKIERVLAQLDWGFPQDKLKSDVNLGAVRECFVLIRVN